MDWVVGVIVWGWWLTGFCFGAGESVDSKGSRRSWCSQVKGEEEGWLVLNESVEESGGWVRENWSLEWMDG